jgi:hypothetical protein
MTGTRSFLLLVLSILASFSAATAGGGDWPAILYEESGATRTPRYDATIAWCRQMAAASDIIHYDTFGISPQGRPCRCWWWTCRGASRPRTTRNEVTARCCWSRPASTPARACGKDAGMQSCCATWRRIDEHVAPWPVWRRSPCSSSRSSTWTATSASAPYGRINQNGPARDGLARHEPQPESEPRFPEGRHRRRCGPCWACSTGLGSGFLRGHPLDRRRRLPVRASPTAWSWAAIMEAGLTEWTAATTCDEHGSARMAADGYPHRRRTSRSASGTIRAKRVAHLGHAGPRFSQGYAAVRNRPGLLIETHMLKDYRPAGRVDPLMLRPAFPRLAERAEADTLRRGGCARPDRFTASPAVPQPSPFP